MYGLKMLPSRALTQWSNRGFGDDQWARQGSRSLDLDSHSFAGFDCNSGALGQSAKPPEQTSTA
jgi:hypothetical protein